MRPRLFVAVVLGLIPLACSAEEPVVIDGSSAERFAATAEQARRDLPVADRLDFDRAMVSAPTRRFGAQDPDALRRLTFDRMTAAEVVADYRARQ